ncbi:MAG: hypothetical protein WCQ64_08655 [Acidobacteriota bacterium]
MTRRLALLIECARRVLPTYVIGVFFMMSLGWAGQLLRLDSAGFATRGTSGILAWAMATAWALALIPTGTLQSREVAQLPVSRRDLWVARWWLAVVMPAATATVASAIGMAMVRASRQAGLPAREIILISGCCAVWGSLSLNTSPANWPGLKSLDGLRPHSRARRVVAYLMTLSVGVWFLAGVALPFALAPIIARAAAQPTMASRVIAMALALLTLARYFHVPPIAARPPAVRGLRPGATNSAPTMAAPSTTPTLTGLGFMYWREARRSLGLVGFIIAAVIGYWWLFGSLPLAAFLRAYWLLPFEGRGSEPPIAFIIILMMLTTFGDEVRRELRRLRTLPLSSWALATALWLRVLIAPLTLWTGAVVMHALVLHTLPTSSRPDVLLLLLGVLATMHAISLAVAGQKTAQSIIFVTLFVATAAMARFWPAARPSMAVAGGILLVSALWLSEWAIQRRSPLYARYNTAVTPAESRFN